MSRSEGRSKTQGARKFLLQLPALSSQLMDQSPLPAMQPYEEVVADYRTAGLSLRAHPISFYRQQLERLGITPAGGWWNWRMMRRFAWRGWCCCGSGRARRRESRSSRSKTKPAR